jgi:hypothetical protein
MMISLTQNHHLGCSMPIQVALQILGVRISGGLSMYTSTSLVLIDAVLFFERQHGSA